jgi:hypothetical protein
MPDKEVVDTFLNDNPDKVPLIQEYLNGKLNSVDMAKQL